MRKQGWESIFNDYIESIAKKKFEWGSCDCLTFASDCAVAICDTDPMSKKKHTDPDTIRGKYDNRDDAYKLIYKYRKSIPSIMDLHFQRIKPNFTTRGDIVLAKLGNLKTFGVVCSGKAFFKTEEEGFVSIPLSEGMIAWRVE